MGNDMLFDGFCPECSISGSNEELWLDKGDVFECPECHLLVTLASGMRAVILRRRGNANFKPFTDTHYGARHHATGLLLVRENINDWYEPDGYNAIKSFENLKEYLSEVIGVDENV